MTPGDATTPIADRPLSNPPRATSRVVPIGQFKGLSQIGPTQAGPGQAGPVQGGPEDSSAALRQVLRVEAEIRGCRSIDELSILLVNEVLKFLAARQSYFIDLRHRHPQIGQVSGTGDFDRNAPTIRWLESELRARPPADGWSKRGAITLRNGTAAEEEEGRLFPFAHGYWLPLSPASEAPIGGVLVVSERLFEEAPTTIGARIVGTASHAAKVLTYRAPRRHSRLLRLLLSVAAVAAVAALFLPVPMTALAPMEIVAVDAFVIAAPIDGVIDSIVAAPNAPVKAGDLLVQYVDTVPRNQLQLAQREVSVAEAKLRQLQQNALVNDDAKRELAQARAELRLKQAEQNFARDTFDKSQIRAPRNGVAVYADRKEWAGKPVVTGQRILEIADAAKVEVRANLPVADMLDLKLGARVRVFLDGDPLHPVASTLKSASIQARVVEGQGLVYRIQATIDPDQRLPRLGVRGTAQLFSDKAPLGYYLFRRPLTWVRQKVGL